MTSAAMHRSGRKGSLVRRVGKASIRGYGVATSGFRRLPDFLVIGAKRGGTTSLFNYLLDHPDVAPPFPWVQQIKGVHFFDTNYARGVRWYRSHFPTRLSSRGQVVGEASPYYLGHPLAARRAAAVAPDAKLIVLLRNPVDRAFSHYRERVRHRSEDLSFEEAIACEDERLEGEVEHILADERYTSFEHEHHGYLAQGRYDELLAPWIEGFPGDHILVVLSERLFADPPTVYLEIVRFLGMREFTPASFPAFNLHPGLPMGSRIRDRLVGYFRPHNRRLGEMLDIDLSGWDS